MAIQTTNKAEHISFEIPGDELSPYPSRGKHGDNKIIKFIREKDIIDELCDIRDWICIGNFI
jgi:hypothetical protein